MSKTNADLFILTLEPCPFVLAYHLKCGKMLSVVSFLTRGGDNIHQWKPTKNCTVLEGGQGGGPMEVKTLD